MIRNILAVISGFVIGGIFVFMFEALGHLIYPVPAGLDVNSSREMIETYIKNAPIGALIAVLVAQCAGSISGGFVTGLISIAKRPTAIIYGVLALIMAALNALIIPHPIWFVIIGLILPIPLSLLGSQVAQKFVEE